MIHPSDSLALGRSTILPALLVSVFLSLLPFRLAAQRSDGGGAPAPSLSVHPWQGARVAVLGDSISDPSFSDRGVTHYWTFLSKWLGWEVYPYARSGRQWDDIPRQADALRAEHGDGVDAILILVGTNDFNHDIPLGEWFKVEKDVVLAANDGQPATGKARLHRVPERDGGTVRGRINTALMGLKESYPAVPIVLMTLPHRGYFFSSTSNVQPDEYYANSLGLWVDQYSEAIREAGRIWAVPVVDLESLSGFTPMVDSQRGYYLGNDGKDYLHPSTLGHERMARVLFYALAAVPL